MVEIATAKNRGLHSGVRALESSSTGTEHAADAATPAAAKAAGAKKAAKKKAAKKTDAPKRK